MKSNIFLFWAWMLLAACQKEESPVHQVDSNPPVTLRTGVADEHELILLVEARNYQMNADSLFMPLQLTVRNSALEIPELTAFHLNGMRLTDDGSGNDRIAQDGIFTSDKCTYFHRSHFDGLDEHDALGFSTFTVTSGQQTTLESELGFTISLECEVEIVECPNMEWYNTSIFGEPCLEFSNCTVTLGLELL